MNGHGDRTHVALLARRSNQVGANRPYNLFEENSHSYISTDFLGKDGCCLLIQLQVGDRIAFFEIDNNFPLTFYD